MSNVSPPEGRRIRGPVISLVIGALVYLALVYGSDRPDSKPVGFSLLNLAATCVATMLLQYLVAPMMRDADYLRTPTPRSLVRAAVAVGLVMFIVVTPTRGPLIAVWVSVLTLVAVAIASGVIIGLVGLGGRLLKRVRGV